GTGPPGCPAVGVKGEMGGAEAEVTVKQAVEVPRPPAVVTENLPVLAPFGTVRVILLPLTAKDVEVPFSVAFVAPVRFAPVMVTLVPGGPLAGEKLLMPGTFN